jgi:DNA-binding LacI/PurR family transcriptional regulator
MSAQKKSAVNLRTVAEHVGLAPCSVSAILNRTPASFVIPQSTKDRVFRAAAELQYRPNLWARSLRTKRTRMVAVIASDFGSPSVAHVVAGAHRRLHQRGYLLVLGTVDPSDANHLAHFQQQGIEGVIAIDTGLALSTELPIAVVELAYMPRRDSFSGHSWLTATGESAAETIIQQIEQQSTARKMIVETRISPVGAEIHGAVVSTAMVAGRSA